MAPADEVHPSNWRRYLFVCELGKLSYYKLGRASRVPRQLVADRGPLRHTRQRSRFVRCSHA